MKKKEQKQPTKWSQMTADFKEKQDQKKQKIKAIPSRWKRFWAWVWYWISFVWIYAFKVLKDPFNLLIFAIVTIIYSGSVWGFYLAALLCGWNATEQGKWLIGIGTSVWAWWLSPAGSPFILLCVFTTLGVRTLMEIIRGAIKRKKVKDNV